MVTKTNVVLSIFKVNNVFGMIFEHILVHFDNHVEPLCEPFMGILLCDNAARLSLLKGQVSIKLFTKLSVRTEPLLNDV